MKVLSMSKTENIKPRTHKINGQYILYDKENSKWKKLIKEDKENIKKKDNIFLKNKINMNMDWQFTHKNAND